MNIPDTKWPPVDADVSTENNIHTYIIIDNYLHKLAIIEEIQYNGSYSTYIITHYLRHFYLLVIHTYMNSNLY